MWLAATLGYWSSLGLVAYTYAGYPALIVALSRLRPRPVRAGDHEQHEPTVSVVLAAHNEQQRIAAKLDNLLALDYPREKVQIVVVSDGSTDETDAIVQRYADRGVVLERNDPATGKPSALNRGMQRATGEIVVFCDTRQAIDAGAIRALVAPFADPAIGAVSGELYLPTDKGPGLYWAYEKVIRAAESRVDSTVGATGALYAIRRELYRELPPDCLLDDVFTPMQIAMQGYRVLFEPGAIARDEEAPLKGELARKARTLAGNFQLLEQLPALLDPRRNRLLWQLTSHKLLRLACPYALVTLLGCNIWLVATAAPGWPFYATTLAGQLAFYGLAASNLPLGRNLDRLARGARTFVVLNAAAVEGLRRYLTRDLGWTTHR